MDRIQLHATRRELAKRTAKHLRQEGLVPCIVYGFGTGNVPIKIPTLELRRTLDKAGASQLIDLHIEGGQTQPVLPREIQRNVLTGDPIHVDFLAVNMSEKITAEITITLVGVPAAVGSREGMLLSGVTSVEIECLPGDLLPTLEVDVSGLEMHESMFVSDIQVPDGITILSDPDQMVAQVTYEEALEEGEEELFAAETAEVEVISRGKGEEEDFD